MRKRIETILKMIVGTDTTNPPGKEQDLVNLIIKFIETVPDKDLTNNILSNKISNNKVSNKKASNKIITNQDSLNNELSNKEKGNKEIHYERVFHVAGRESLVITIPGEDSNRVLGFAGHLDTVPIGNSSLWNYNPLGEIVGDIMYGRGTTDMGGGLTAMLLILEYYKQKIPPVTLKLIFTADEEANGTGAKELLEKGYFNEITNLILCEPSNLNLGTCEKGTLWLKIIVSGTSCHASMPVEGKNALQVGMYFISDMKENLENMIKPNILLGNTTCEVTKCSSGIKVNIIPDYAEFEVDIRTIPFMIGENAIILNSIHELKKSYEEQYGIHISIEVFGNREPIEEPYNSEFIKQIKKAVEGILLIEHTGIYFFTDGSLIIPKLKIPFVILGPGNPKQCHKVDEHISLEEIEQCFYLYQHIIDSY